MRSFFGWGGYEANREAVNNNVIIHMLEIGGQKKDILHLKEMTCEWVKLIVALLCTLKNSDEM